MPHTGVHKHSLQYDERPDWRFRVWVETWNIGSQDGRMMDV